MEIVSETFASSTRRTQEKGEAVELYKLNIFFLFVGMDIYVVIDCFGSCPPALEKRKEVPGIL